MGISQEASTLNFHIGCLGIRFLVTACFRHAGTIYVPFEEEQIEKRFLKPSWATRRISIVNKSGRGVTLPWFPRPDPRPNGRSGVAPLPTDPGRTGRFKGGFLPTYPTGVRPGDEGREGWREGGRTATLSTAGRTYPREGRSPSPPEGLPIRPDSSRLTNPVRWYGPLPPPRGPSPDVLGSAVLGFISTTPGGIQAVGREIVEVGAPTNAKRRKVGRVLKPWASRIHPRPGTVSETKVERKSGPPRIVGGWQRHRHETKTRRLAFQHGKGPTRTHSRERWVRETSPLAACLAARSDAGIRNHRTCAARPSIQAVRGKLHGRSRRVEM
eukprot:scaffold456_cov368-Pavlova_lutheri.AAC.24